MFHYTNLFPFYPFISFQRVNQCLQDACHLAKLPGCMDLVYRRSKESNISATWINNDAGANACLNSTSGPFSYGIYANAIPLTLETNMTNKYVYALFWGFQVCIFFLLFFFLQL